MNTGIDLAELRGKSLAEQKELLLELRKEQFNLRMQQGTQQLTRPHLMRRVRKDIARVKMLMGEKRTETGGKQ